MLGSREERAITHLQSQLSNKVQQHKITLIFSTPKRYLTFCQTESSDQKSPEIRNSEWSGPLKQPWQVASVVAKVAKQIPINTEHRKLMHPKEASQRQNSYIELGLTDFQLISSYSSNQGQAGGAMSQYFALDGRVLGLVRAFLIPDLDLSRTRKLLWRPGEASIGTCCFSQLGSSLS